MEPKKKHSPTIFFIVMIISVIIASVLKPTPKPRIHDGIVTYKDESEGVIYYFLTFAVLMVIFFIARPIVHSLISKLKKRKPIEENSNSAKPD